MKKIFYFFLFCLLLTANCQLVFSQKSTSVSIAATSADSMKIDTNYLKSYDNKLVVGLWHSERKFDITIDQKIFSDTSIHSDINYIANANHVEGISFDYDIIGLAFGYKSVASGNKRTGNTDYVDLGLNINTNGFRFENSFRRYTGFYDNNTKNYVLPFTDTTAYFQNPSLTISQVKSKLIYTISHKRFSLSGAYANVKRQVKSAGSILLIYNFYGLSMYSDSSFIPPPQQKYYGVIWDGLNKMNAYAYSAGVGYTRTFVIWKKLFFNLFAGIGYERQYRHFYTYPENVHYSYWKTWYAGDLRTSFGYNGKRFFIRNSTSYDVNNYESKELNFKMQFIATSFDFGYRFKFKAPKPYRKFQETKIYKML